MARKMNDDRRGAEDQGMRSEDRGGRRQERSRRRFGRSSDEQAFYAGALPEDDGELDGPAIPMDFDTLGNRRERREPRDRR